MLDWGSYVPRCTTVADMSPCSATQECTQYDSCAGCTEDYYGYPLSYVGMSCYWDMYIGCTFDYMTQCKYVVPPPCSQADGCAGCMYDGNGNPVMGDMDCYHNGAGCERNDAMSHCSSSLPQCTENGCNCQETWTLAGGTTISGFRAAANELYK